MIAMTSNGSSVHQKEFDIDFDDVLPDWDGFPVFWVAKRWHCTSNHILNLIDSGEIKVPIDLRNKASSRAMIRIPRGSLIEFINRRKVRQ
jgi:hypothetical protein